ncbi:MAG: signal peptidase II, partial [Erysipelotrichaceae bacterium]|nr:signal peptidase II [Erysipelotrichaceae bacterium]
IPRWLRAYGKEGLLLEWTSGRGWPASPDELRRYALVFWYLYRNEKISAIYRFGLVMIAAGAFGNLIDRISYAYVIDFLDFYIFGYNFPVFNFADCCITIGAGLLITDILFSKEQV